MKRFITPIAFLISLILPFFLLMTSIRLMFSPLFLTFEYNRPGFPVDDFGFTTADRLKYGGISVDYLFNGAEVAFLQDVTMENGLPLYNEREISHMLDVKILVQQMITAWVILAFFLVGMGLVAWRTGWLKTFWRSLVRGGWFTLGLIAAILFGVGLSFDWLFTKFHEIFFTGDTWLFYYSDSLIRLFPIDLWRDAFIGVGFFAILMAILNITLGRRLSR